MVETLQRLAELVVKAIYPPNSAGSRCSSMASSARGCSPIRGRPRSIRHSTSRAAGPVWNRSEQARFYGVDSTAQPGRWPEFSAACREHGIISTASFPIVIDDARQGALNVYSKAEAAFGSHEIITGRQFAAQAGVVITYARSYWDARQLTQQLRAAMEHRAEIEQAKGIIIGSMGCTADEAFEILVKQSQHENRKLRDIAIELVNRKIRAH